MRARSFRSIWGRVGWRSPDAVSEQGDLKPVNELDATQGHQLGRLTFFDLPPLSAACDSLLAIMSPEPRSAGRKGLSVVAATFLVWH